MWNEKKQSLFDITNGGRGYAALSGVGFDLESLQSFLVDL